MRFGVAHSMRIQALAFALTVLRVASGHAQNATPSVSDPHFCEFWQDRIGIVSPHARPASRRSKHSPSGERNSPPYTAEVQEFASSAPIDPEGVSNLAEPEIIAAMSCLLSLEDDTHLANFGGPTWAGVSQLFEIQVPINLEALYYISYLYAGNWKHGNAVALRGPGADSSRGPLYVTRQEAVHKAYASYRHWFEEMKRIGLNMLENKSSILSTARGSRGTEPHHKTA